MFAYGNLSETGLVFSDDETVRQLNRQLTVLILLVSAFIELFFMEIRLSRSDRQGNCVNYTMFYFYHILLIYFKKYCYSYQLLHLLHLCIKFLVILWLKIILDRSLPNNFQHIGGFLNGMCYINTRFTYYLLTFVFCVQLLRSTLDAEGHDDVLIVAPDAKSWDILKTFAADQQFLQSVDIVG